MIKFFRDVLNGPLYIIVVLLSIILIMAIIGFMLERKQKEKEARDKMAFIDRDNVPTTAEGTATQPVISEVKEEIPVETDESKVETNE